MRKRLHQKARRLLEERDTQFKAEVILQSYDARGKTKRYWIAPKEEAITGTKTILPLMQK